MKKCPNYSHKNGDNTLFFDMCMTSLNSVYVKKYSLCDSENHSNQAILETGSFFFNLLSLLKF